LENRLDGACARFLNYKKDFKSVPYALFVNGNSSANIKNGSAMLNEKAIHITKAVFGEGVKEGMEQRLGKAVVRQYGKGEEGFNVSSCQFALHYFFESQTTFQNFMRNVSECTKVGGYFTGSCYDGKLIYNLLKSKKEGESIELYDDDIKIWEIRKEYDVDYFDDDASSIGYKISVYQDSINKMFPEFLVNFDYLERIMENYGFMLITRDEAKSIGLPEGSGLFGELFNQMLDESKTRKYKKNPYGSALEMNYNEKKISFLNRYFVYKKIRHVNAEKIALEQMDENMDQVRTERKETRTSVKVAKEVVKELAKATKSRARKLKNKLVLVAATDAFDEEPNIKEPVVKEVVVEEPVIEEEPPLPITKTILKTKDKTTKPKTKKLKFNIQEVPVEEIPVEEILVEKKNKSLLKVKEKFTPKIIIEE
jgi:hypothetical protein